VSAFGESVPEARNGVDDLGVVSMNRRGGLLLAAMLVLVSSCVPVVESGCSGLGRVLNVGFYAYFEPVSYSAAADPFDPMFDTHRGYEADLLTAVENMDGTGLRFERRAIGAWDGIWLRPAGDDFDIVGGGITILDSRTTDASGDQVVAFTSGHITFHQSLLVRAGDADRLATHADLNSEVVIGALAGTTGEARFLVLAGIANDAGVLAAGVRVETPVGTTTADGTDAFFINAAGASPGMEDRSYLHPGSESMPQVMYPSAGGGDAELINAVTEGSIDGVAGALIGNTAAADASAGALVVTALDTGTDERGGFAVAADDTDLLHCLNTRIGWLTDNNRIGYPEWHTDPTIFTTRAQLWNEQN